jgi:putative ABC transport system ATP-binding protein
MAVPLIQTRRLSKEYRTGGIAVAALREVTIEVTRSEFVAIVGPSGSGKSTLMNLLGLLDRPSAGSYRFAGQETRDLKPDACARLRSREIGFVFQNYNLLGRSTALENVALPLAYAGTPRRLRHARAMEMLAFVGLEHRLHHWPGQLSGGEQQRVAIARALVNDPALVLADEPTGALDSATGRSVMAMLRTLGSSGRTIVMVTHNPAVAAEADRLIAMQDGAVLPDQGAAPHAAPARARR